MKHLSFLIILVLLFSNQAFAQKLNYSIKFDSEENEVIQFAPQSQPFFLYKFIPGMYQLKKGEFKKGLAFTTASISWALFYFNSKKSKPFVKIPPGFPYTTAGNNFYFRDYQITKDEYDIGIQDITSYLKNDHEYLTAKSKFDKKITAFHITGLSLYGLHLIDALIIPKIVESKTSRRVLVSQKLNQGKSLYVSGKYNDTKKVLTGLLQYENLETNYLEDILLYLSLSHFKKGERTDAEKYLEHLLNLNPGKEIESELLAQDVLDFINGVKSEKYGSIVIDSQQPDTKVYINGNEVGNAPYKNDLIHAGTYTVGLLRFGFDLIEKELTVMPSQLTSFDTTTYTLGSTGILIIDSDPQAVEININGYFVGETPMVLEDQPPGYYNIRLEELKYHSEKTIVSLNGGDTTRVKLRLRKIKDYFIYSELVPGLSQWVTGHPFRGSFWMLATLGWAYQFSQHGSKRPDVFYYSNDQLYENVGQYYIGTTEITKEEYDNELEKIIKSNKSQEEMETWERQREALLATGVGIYVLNLIDTFLIFRSGNDENSYFSNDKLRLDLYSNYDGFGINLRYKF